MQITKPPSFIGMHPNQGRAMYQKRVLEIREAKNFFDGIELNTQQIKDALQSIPGKTIGNKCKIINTRYQLALKSASNNKEKKELMTKMMWIINAIKSQNPLFRIFPDLKPFEDLGQRQRIQKSFITSDPNKKNQPPYLFIQDKPLVTNLKQTKKDHFAYVKTKNGLTYLFVNTNVIDN